MMTLMADEERDKLSPPMSKNDIIRERKILKGWADDAFKNGNYSVAQRFEYMSRTVCNEELKYG